VACAREAARVLRSGGLAVILDKFLPDDTPPLILCFAAPLASLFGTEITRQLGPILNGSGFTIVANDPAALRGLFWIILVEKGLQREREQART
jgi:phosphatidylethanolamine/phosphatidyl-N-methylethanolamine N-methyltransferase